MKERFMKNGVFSLEYDKETLRDMVLELQQENSQLKGSIQTYDILLKANVEENKQLKERIEYLERSNNRREDTILEQRQKISDLEDNWNKLKEYINKRNETLYWTNTYDDILDKMQELEQGRDSDE